MKWLWMGVMVLAGIVLGVGIGFRLGRGDSRQSKPVVQAVEQESDDKFAFGRVVAVGVNQITVDEVFLTDRDVRASCPAGSAMGWTRETAEIQTARILLTAVDGRRPAVR